MTIELEIPGTGSTQMKSVRKSADQDSSTTAMADVTELAFAIAALEAATFEFNLFCKAQTGDDIKFAITCPAGAALSWYATGADVAASDTPIIDAGTLALRSGGLILASGTSISLGTSGRTATQPVEAILHGSILNGATPGTVQLRFAQRASASGQPSTIIAGSYLVPRRI